MLLVKITYFIVAILSATVYGNYWSVYNEDNYIGLWKVWLPIMGVKQDRESRSLALPTLLVAHVFRAVNSRHSTISFALNTIPCNTLSPLLGCCCCIAVNDDTGPMFLRLLNDEDPDHHWRLFRAARIVYVVGIALIGLSVILEALMFCIKRIGRMCCCTTLMSVLDFIGVAMLIPMIATWIVLQSQYLNDLPGGYSLHYGPGWILAVVAVAIAIIGVPLLRCSLCILSCCCCCCHTRNRTPEGQSGVEMQSQGVHPAGAAKGTSYGNQPHTAVNVA